MTNETIRNAAKQAGVKLWEIAEYCGVTDSTFSRQMRREFPSDKQKLVLDGIDQIAQKKAEQVVASSPE